jgi:hypothetical protein
MSSRSQLFLTSATMENANEFNPYYNYYIGSSGKGVGDSIGHIYSQNPYYQKGYGFLGRQRGRGIGSALSSLWRFAFPIIKRGAKTLGTAAADVASNIASDVLQGKNLKESALEHAKAKGLELLKEVPAELNKMSSTTDEIATPPPDLVVQRPPPEYRRVNRKRKNIPSNEKKVGKKNKRVGKYPALKHFQ